MTEAKKSSKYDWTQPPKPPGFVKWIAAHRILVRIILACIDTALVVFLIEGLVDHDNRWSDYVQLVVYASVTVNLGWVMPKTVDTWHRRHDQQQANN